MIATDGDSLISSTFFLYAMPSIRIRNRIAGQISRVKKNTKKIIDETEEQ